MELSHIFSPAERPELFCPLMRIDGAKPGPRLVVTGDRALIEALANRLWGLTNLPALRGSLLLRDGRQTVLFDRPDNVLALDCTVEQAYRQTLGRLTALGMIAGRGVPLRWVA